MTTVERQVKQLFKLADIKINGSRAQDITVSDNRFYKRIIRYRELGLGESYMDGWWESKSIDKFITNVLNANLREKVKVSPGLILAAASSAIFNKQTVNQAKRNAEHHYNIGNDLYEHMLDKRMIYSCAYWKNAKTLDEAQENKLDLICKKLQLKRGMKLLDIGCGWGGFAKFAATKYGVNVTGISPASEQVKFAKSVNKGLRVKILQKDYRQLSGKYDRIVSIGMLEHVGPKNYNKFFKICSNLLSKNGIMLHHTIAGNSPDKYGDPWVSKYIFPGGLLPTLSQISTAVEKLFVIEDVQNMGPDYDKTLMAWYKNFKKTYSQIKDNYDERFYRMWEYYLLTSAAAFRSRQIQLYQVVMRKIEPSSTYISPR